MDIFQMILNRYQIVVEICNNILESAIMPKVDKTLAINDIKNYTETLNEINDELSEIINNNIIDKICPISVAPIIKELIEIVKQMVIENEELQDISIKYIDYTFLNKNSFLNRRFSKEIEKKHRNIMDYLNNKFFKKLNELAIITKKENL